MPVETIEPQVNGVVKQPPEGGVLNFGDFVLSFAAAADDFPVWGSAPAARDIKLREFWPTEPVLASALTSTISKYAGFGWGLSGPPRAVHHYETMLHSADRGKGWIGFITKILFDVFTQDNGAFIEIIRTEDNERAPVVNLNHLDSGRCIRTGRDFEPVIYRDLYGILHTMKWYQVIPIEEMPSPIESARGMQYCVLTRLLRAAQIMRDIGIYKREKISGRFNRAIHLVSGVQTRSIDDAVAQQRANADTMGLMRYLQPLIIGALDPTARVSLATIDLASLPDGFDEDKTMRWYINQLAMAFAGDYQDYAPLPGGGLGTSQQSETLHLKAQNKGARLFMSILEHKFNYHGVFPRNVRFKFGDQDISEDAEATRLRQMRAEERSIRIASGEITAQMARQLAVDAGDLDPIYLLAIGEEDITPVGTGVMPEPQDVPKLDPPMSPQEQAALRPGITQAGVAGGLNQGSHLPHPGNNPSQTK